jgi:hypothetical protein
MKDKQEKWEEEFNKEFGYSSWVEFGELQAEVSIKELKSFISHLLKAQKAELAKKVEGMKIKLGQRNHEVEQDVAYNHACDDFIKLLEE